MLHVGNKIPLSKQVAGSLKQQVRRGVYQSGSSLPPIRRLCDEFGVSLNVVYRAIHELEEEGIVETHHGKGMTIRKENPADRTAILFGFIHPFPAEMIFEQQMLQYAEQGFSARDNFMVVRSSKLDTALEREIAEHFVNNGVQGILVWPVEDNPNGKFFEELSKKVPVVFVDRLLDDTQLPAVIFDTYEAGRDICLDVLGTRKRRRMLALIDDLQISPYQNLMQGIRDEAYDMGRSEDITITQIGISDFIKQLNSCDFSKVDSFKEYIEKLINDDGYDTLFCPQEEFLDYVIVQTGLYDQLDDFQLVAVTGPGANARTRKYNELGVWKWVADFPQMISQAADMLQRFVLTRNVTNDIIRLKINQSEL